jgi:tRNA(Ile2)-agmatinylcytidine synthase
MHIGFDDTDSTRQGCTTYIASKLIEELEKLNVKFLDYPNLIRLNPNVPWKTRGNGALCLRIEFNEDLEEKIKELSSELIEKNSELEWKGTDPGIVFLKASSIPPELTFFSKKAETEVVTLSNALKLLSKYQAEAFGYNSQRGIIGAIAAIGETLSQDHTFELIAYREKQNIGTKRRVDEKSIFEMDEALKPFTFNNVDYETKRVIITPRGPDPILFGVRGETPQIVKKAFEMVKPLEPVDRWVVFRTNQGTDAHLKRLESLKEAKPYTSIIAKGLVSRKPTIVPVRHVIFAIKDNISEVDCAAYEPTGQLRKAAIELMIGDSIEIYGAVRKASKDRPLTINLEKFNVLNLAPLSHFENPKCPDCGKHLKSMGKNQGFRCEKCKTKFKAKQKKEIAQQHKLSLGLYVTSTRSQRHLTKPIRRYGQEKNEPASSKLIEGWHSIWPIKI